MAYLVISSKKVTRTIHVKDGRAFFSTPYCCDYALDNFKTAVPWQERKWEPTTKTWSVQVKHLDALKEFAAAFGPVEVQEAQ